MPQEPAANQLSEGDAVIFVVDVTDQMLTDREDDTVSIIRGQTALVVPMPEHFPESSYICVRLDYDNRMYIIRQTWVKKVDL